MKILQICLTNKIQISIDWIPRDLNVEADALSKVIDSDDWSIAPNVFHMLSTRYGPFTVDLFASNITAKVDKFYAKFWCKGVKGVDAFAYNWGAEHCWIVPPPKLVPQVIKHMKQCRAKGVMLVPRWQTAVYWPMLHDGASWAPGVSLLLEYQKPKKFFIPAPGGNDVFNENQFLSNMLVLMIKFD
jgi:hypothetical protein